MAVINIKIKIVEGLPRQQCQKLTYITLGTIDVASAKLDILAINRRWDDETRH